MSYVVISHLRRPNVASVIESLAAIGINASVDEVNRRIDWMLEFKEKKRGGWYSDSAWIGWLKFALIERIPSPGQKHLPEASTATLHVGFVSVEETAEQVERLRNEQASYKPSIARSKIGTTNLSAVSPVDRVAKRVSHQ